MVAFGTFLAIGVFAMLTFLWLEVTQYARGRSLLTKRRLWVRVIGGILFITLFSAVFAGLFLLDLQHPTEKNLMVWGLFWSGCTILGLALMVLAFEDFKAVAAARREQESKYWHDVAAMVASSAPTRPTEPSPNGGGPNSTPTP